MYFLDMFQRVFLQVRRRSPDGHQKSLLALCSAGIAIDVVAFQYTFSKAVLKTVEILPG
jgi:hypothetical protein